MKHYMFAKIGKVFSWEVCDKMYKLEVLCIRGNSVVFNVTSKGITPAGVFKKNTYEKYGEVSIDLTNKSKNDVIWNAILNADYEFIKSCDFAKSI